MTNVRQRLIAIREKAGLTQEQACERMGLRWDTYRRFEVSLDKNYASTPNLRCAIAIRNLTADLGDEIDPECWIDEQDERARS
jgi:hypothetical protein